MASTREESPNETEEMEGISFEIDFTLRPTAIDLGGGKIDPQLSFIDNPPIYLTGVKMNGREQIILQQESSSKSMDKWSTPLSGLLLYQPMPLVEFIDNPPAYLIRTKSEEEFSISDIAVVSSCMAYVLGFVPRGIFLEKMTFTTGTATLESKHKAVFLGLGALVSLVKPLKTDYPQSVDNIESFMNRWRALLKSVGLTDQISASARAQLLNLIIKYQDIFRFVNNKFGNGVQTRKLWKKAVVQQLVAQSGVNCIMKQLDLVYNMAEMTSLKNMDLFINCTSGAFVMRIIAEVRDDANRFKTFWENLKGMYPKTYVYGKVLGYNVPVIKNYPNLYFAASQWATQSKRLGPEGKFQFRSVFTQIPQDLIKEVVRMSLQQSL